MIRLWLENGKCAIYEDDERVAVCSNLIGDEYIEDDRTVRADELLTAKEQGRGIGYVFLSLPRAALGDMNELAPAGRACKTGGKEPWDLYRVIRIDRF